MHKMPAVAFISLALVVALAGCTTHLESSPSDPVTAAYPTPSATTVAALPTPTTRVALTCADTLPAEFRLAGFTWPLKPTDPTTFTDYTDGATHATYHVRALGGIDCAWWNDEAPHDAQDDPPYATVRILPAAASEWRKNERSGHFTGTRHESCGVVGSESTWCSLDAYANGYWVSAELDGIQDDGSDGTAHTPRPAIAAVFDTLMAKVESLPAAVSGIRLSGASLTLPNTCAAILPTRALATALKSTGPLHYDDFDAVYSLYSSALSQSSEVACTLALHRTDHYSPVSYGHLGFLPGGAWAAAQDAKLHPGTSITVPGLQPGDAASTHHGDLPHALVVDLVIGGNWIEFTLHDSTTKAPHLGTSQAEGAQRIVAAIVKHLRHARKA